MKYRILRPCEKIRAGDIPRRAFENFKNGRPVWSSDVGKKVSESGYLLGVVRPIKEIKDIAQEMARAIRPLVKAINRPNYERVGLDREEVYADTLRKNSFKLRKALESYDQI